jgi:23S rRNA pseudouridine2605 synthase
MESLSRAVWLSDVDKKAGSGAGRSRLKLVKRSRDLTILEITIREGRNRQIRQMLARVGYKLRELTRIKMGPLTLEGLSTGQFRFLTPREIAKLQKTAREQSPHQPPVSKSKQTTRPQRS